TALIALTGSAQDLAAVGLVVGRGVQPMLASTASTVAEALAVALDAYKRGYSNATSDAFKKAADVSRTHAEALAVAETAGQKGYSNAASYAFKRAEALLG
ncbi:MAG: hypothetical protein ACK46X_21085, partial [Candidatus Sericytochromatia bacterium]